MYIKLSLTHFIFRQYHNFQELLFIQGAA